MWTTRVCKTNFDGDGVYTSVYLQQAGPLNSRQAVTTLLQSAVDSSLNPATKTFYGHWYPITMPEELGGALVVMQDDVPDSIMSQQGGRNSKTAGLPEELSRCHLLKFLKFWKN